MVEKMAREVVKAGGLEKVYQKRDSIYAKRPVKEAQYICISYIQDGEGGTWRYKNSRPWEGMAKETSIYTKRHIKEAQYICIPCVKGGEGGMWRCKNSRPWEGMSEETRIYTKRHIKEAQYICISCVKGGEGGPWCSKSRRQRTCRKILSGRYSTVWRRGMYVYVYTHMYVMYEYIATNACMCILYTTKCCLDGIQRFGEEVCMCMCIHICMSRTSI